MPKELETVLRLVAEGHLSPEEAAPIIDALTGADRGRGAADGLRDDAARLRDRAATLRDHAYRARDAARAIRDEVGAIRDRSAGRQIRVRVTERGRQVVNLRIPLAFADVALHTVPGLSGSQADRVRAAIAGGEAGPILDVEDEDGSGVLIAIE